MLLFIVIFFCLHHQMTCFNFYPDTSVNVSVRNSNSVLNQNVVNSTFIKTNLQSTNLATISASLCILDIVLIFLVYRRLLSLVTRNTALIQENSILLHQLQQVNSPGNN